MADEELITLNPEDYYDEQVFNHNFNYLENELKNKARLVNGKVPLSQLTIDTELSLDSVAPVGNKFIKRVIDSKADLNENGKIPEEQLPSYVDDVVEYDSVSDFPAEGEKGKIYVDTEKNETYRWSGTMYVKIGSTKEEYKAVSVTSDASVVEIPDEAVDYAAVSMIGGKTVKTKNLIPFPYYFGDTIISQGVTFTSRPDGWITLNGESGSAQPYVSIAYRITNMAIKPGDKFTFSFEGNAVSRSNVYIGVYVYNTTTGNNRSVSVPSNEKKVTITIGENESKLTPYIWGVPNTVYSNVTIRPMLVEGEEPSAYEPYFSGLHNAAVESVVSTMANGNKSTLSLSELTKNLPDFGCSAGDIYNYVDIEEMKYHRKCKEIDLADVSGWNTHTGLTSAWYVKLSDALPQSDSVVCSTLICNKYSTDKRTNMEDKSVCINSLSHIIVRDTDISSLADFNSKRAGIKIVYELATEEIIDIKPLATILPVEAGGTIEFVNEHNLDVPNTVLYKEVL